MPDEAARQQAEDHYYAALDLYAEGEHEQAVAEYQKSIASDPTFCDALHGLARAYQDMNKLDESDLRDDVEGIISAAQFIDLTEGAQLLFI